MPKSRRQPKQARTWEIQDAIVPEQADAARDERARRLLASLLVRRIAADYTPSAGAGSALSVGGTAAKGGG